MKPVVVEASAAAVEDVFAAVVVVVAVLAAVVAVGLRLDSLVAQQDPVNCPFVTEVSAAAVHVFASAVGDVVADASVVDSEHEKGVETDVAFVDVGIVSAEPSDELVDVVVVSEDVVASAYVPVEDAVGELVAVDVPASAAALAEDDAAVHDAVGQDVAEHAASGQDAAAFADHSSDDQPGDAAADAKYAVAADAVDASVGVADVVALVVVAVAADVLDHVVAASSVEAGHAVDAVRNPASFGLVGENPAVSGAADADLAFVELVDS